MTNYTRGRAFEYRVKAFFERLGWWVCRAAGSHGKADLVAVRAPNFHDAFGPGNPLPGETAFIQAKLGAISKSEREEFWRLCERYAVDPLLAVKKGRGKYEIRRMIGPDPKQSMRIFTL
jgi:hypothetical protein